LLWLVAAYIFVAAFDFRYPGNVAPLLLGGAALTLLSGLLLRGVYSFWRSGRPDVQPALSSPSSTELDSKGHTPATKPDSNERAALLWTAITAVALILLGFLVGVTLALVGLLRVHGRESWPMTILVTALIQATLYIAFGVILRVRFFPGLLAELLP
jgi:ABC-type sugar transport system permease subunit